MGLRQRREVYSLLLSFLLSKMECVPMRRSDGRVYDGKPLQLRMSKELTAVFKTYADDQHRSFNELGNYIIEKFFRNIAAQEAKRKEQ